MKQLSSLKAAAGRWPGMTSMCSWSEPGWSWCRPVTPDLARAARRAWRRFGKGNHPAGLNFGDCFSYALAEAVREPLLFKGEDFARTDIEAA